MRLRSSFDALSVTYSLVQIVLAVGNYMNAGNHRVGGATGFRISYLTQVRE